MIRPALLVFVAAIAAFASLPAAAHEVRPGYLELRQTGAESYDVLWKVPARGDLRLSMVPKFPEGCRLASEPVQRQTEQAFTERGSISCPGGLEDKQIEIDGLSATLTDVLVRVVRLDGAEQVVRLAPSSPSFVVEASPNWIEVARTYLELGVEHILFGIDHLLFVVALLLITRGTWQLVKTITAFTIAHSITLALATLGLVHVPAAPVEATIALSIVFVATEIIHLRRGRESLTTRAPWIVAFAFGLLHGFGFAGALAELGLPQQAIPLALLFFNLGVELGQLLFVAAMLLSFRIAMVAVRNVTLAEPRSVAAWQTPAAYMIGAVAAFWLVERTFVFWL